VQKLCRCEHSVFTNRTCFILEHYFASKSFAAVREAFSNAYHDTEEPNKITPTGNKILGHRKCLRQETSAVKLFCSFFVTNTDQESTRLFDVTKAYKYCCSYGCVLNGALCIIKSLVVNL
jgi:hypothetical protein